MKKRDFLNRVSPFRGYLLHRFPGYGSHSPKLGRGRLRQIRAYSLILVTMSLLTGCGGGSSSSGSLSIYAGIYLGTEVVKQDNGLNKTTPIKFIVSSDGTIVNYDWTLGGICNRGETQENSQMVSGNTLSYKFSGKCGVTGIGDCDIVATDIWKFSSTGATRESRFDITCGMFTSWRTINGSYNKVAN